MYVYEIAYTLDGECHETFGPGSGVYTCLVGADSKQEALDKVRMYHLGRRNALPRTPHVARWKGRHESVKRGVIADSDIDIK